MVRIYNWHNKSFMFEYNEAARPHKIVYYIPAKYTTTIKPNGTFEVETRLFIRSLFKYIKETCAWPSMLKLLSERSTDFLTTNDPFKFISSLKMVFEYLNLIKPLPRKPHLIRFLEELQNARE